MSNSQSKSECELSCYKRDAELTILCHVSKAYVMFLFMFNIEVKVGSLRPNIYVINARN